MAKAVLVVALILCAAGCRTQPVAPVSPEKALGGRSAAQLSAEWWKWAKGVPDDVNPVRDTTGEHCAVGQRGAVWFLAGGFGSSRIIRKCVIPAGRYIFFPVVNMAYWPSSDDSGLKCEKMKQAAALNNDTALELFASVDGVEIPGVERYRAKTETCFDIFERLRGAEGPHAGFPSASDGFWLLLPPLAKGPHTIKFGGMYNRASGAYGRMVQDIEYYVTVQ
jgi:hypothetical protein